MKKIFPSLVGIATFSMASLFVSSQTPTDKINQDLAIESIHKPSAPSVSDKNILSRIHIKAVRYFMTTYPKVYNETWQVFKDGYVVVFLNNDVETKNYFDKRGNWLYSIKRYDASRLPERVRAAIKSIYYDYAITQIQEINMRNGYGEQAYLVYIQFGTTFKIIRYCDEGIEEMHY